VHLTLSLPIVGADRREIGDIYWMALAGNKSPHDFTLMTLLAGGITFYPFR